MFWWDTLWFTGMPSFVNLAENRSKGKGFGIGQESLVFEKTVGKPGRDWGWGRARVAGEKGLGRGQGCGPLTPLTTKNPESPAGGREGVGCGVIWSGS